jgi:L-alanine-DL-glutamate epimerase-like enolase superfamily enzyme
MPRIASFELWGADLPFRQAFKHAAAERLSSDSIFLQCTLDNGVSGFGESLPRVYVSGETRNGAFDLLADHILPRLIGQSFADMAELLAFLDECDGTAPAGWVDPAVPQSAAWCAVDLALLDAFGRAGSHPVALTPDAFPGSVRYSPVVSSSAGAQLLLFIRLLRFPQVKLKVGAEGVVECVARARRLLGKRRGIRVDANMAWTVHQALEYISALREFNVQSFEQPLPAEDLAGMARLVADTGAQIMADEGLTTRPSLDRLISLRSANAVNLRISKCGGLVGTLNRARQAHGAGLVIQAGCQVGESSLLSAAHLILVSAIHDVAYAEGCFGLRLLHEDPAAPVLQFHAGGRPPRRPQGPGLGVAISTAVVARWSQRHVAVG